MFSLHSRINLAPIVTFKGGQIFYGFKGFNNETRKTNKHTEPSLSFMKLQALIGLGVLNILY